MTVADRVKGSALVDHAADGIGKGGAFDPVQHHSGYGYLAHIGLAPGLAMHQPPQQIGFAFVVAGGGHAACQADTQGGGGAFAHNAISGQSVFALKIGDGIVGVLTKYSVHRTGKITVLF